MGLGFGSGCLGAGCFGSVCFGTWGCLMSSLMFILCLYEKEKGGVLQLLIFFTVDPSQAEMEA